MAKEEAAPLSPVRRRLSPTKQRKDAPSSSEPRPLIVLLRFVCGSLCFMGGIGCLAAALPVILSAGHDLEIAQIVRPPLRRRTRHTHTFTAPTAELSLTRCRFDGVPPPHTRARTAL